MKLASLKILSFFFSFLVLVPVGSRAQQEPASQNPFPIPADLESAVEFWKQIFSEYGIAQLVYFDPLDPSKIYEVVDVGEETRSNHYIKRERARIAKTHGVDIERVKTQRGVKERTAAGLKRAGRYIAQIQQIFRDRGMPPELSYLPIVESSYDIDARSSVGALGIWQFMRSTGREYMRVTRTIDERRDPFDSSRAAAAYLQEAYENLGNWPLAITSYNYGQAGMARAVATVGSNDLVDLIRHYDHRRFGFAPKHFYAEFLAALEIGSNIQKYFPELELDAPTPIEEMELTARTSMASLVKSTGLNRRELLAWNPALRMSTNVVPAGYRVKLPKDPTSEPLIDVAQIPKVVHHRVKRGDTLLQIARRYGASLQQILKANGMSQAHVIRVGTTLVIPQI